MGDDGESKLAKMVRNYKAMNLDCLIALGGAGTHKNAALLQREGCNVIGVPKTIDNDIYGTDVTFGFQTAVEVACDCIDRIRTTAESHSRVMLVEVMGNKAGWLALHAGIAAGADAILIPEIPFSEDKLCDFVASKKSLGKRCVIVVVAEGAHVKSDAGLKRKKRAFVRTELNEVTTGCCAPASARRRPTLPPKADSASPSPSRATDWSPTSSKTSRANTNMSTAPTAW